MPTRTRTTILMIATLLTILLAIPLGESQAQPYTGPDEPPTADPTLRPLLQARIAPPDPSRQYQHTPSAPQYPARSTAPLALTGNIAFETDRAASFDVYAQDADGSNPAVPLAVSPGSDFTPVWSPDATQLVFASDRDGDFDVYLRTASGEERNLTSSATADDAHPSWSPAGDRIIFTSNRGGDYFQIYTMRPDGTDVQQIGVVPDNNAMYPHYSPDGSRIAFMRASTTLAICEWNWDVWVMDADGSNQQRVTAFIAADLYPNWTPDGTEIVYASCRNLLDADLYAVNPDTGAERQINSWFLSNEWGAIYSPDAEHLAFNTNVDGNTEIYIGPAAGGAVFNLTQHAAEDLAASWGHQDAPETYAISGQVTADPTTPIPGVTISDDKGHTALTNSDGDYTLSGLAAGTYVLTPTLGDWTFTPPTRPVTVPPSATGQDFTGVQPPCDLDKQPVLLIHGWGGPDELENDTLGFKQLYPWMQADGYELDCNLFYATNITSTNSREENRQAIQENLWEAHRTFKSLNPSWDGHFDIIGHSYGGLNARFYLESPYYEADRENGIHVDNLFTLGAPHGGACIGKCVLRSTGIKYLEEAYPAALYIAGRHLLHLENFFDFLSAASLHATAMDLYNFSHAQPQDVCYRLIGGDFLQQENVPWGIRLVYWLFPPGDIAVSLRSSRQLGTNPLLRFSYPRVVPITNADMHGYLPRQTGVPVIGELDLSDLHSYVRPNSMDPVSTYERVIADSLGDPIEQCPSTQAYARAVSPGNTEPTDLTRSPVLLRTDVITGGQTITGTLPVDWSGQTAFYVTWMSGDLDLTLRDPSGTLFTPTVAINDPNADYGELTFGASGLATYIFTHTLTGAWAYTITATSGPYPIPFDLYVNPDSPLVARASAPEWQPFGTSATITATLSYSTTPVTGATVQARVTRPDGVKGTVPLHDDGLSPDATANDGTYSGTYSDTTVGGFYHVLVEADGTHATQPYHRSAQAVFPVPANSASLTGAYTAQPNDDNRDQLYEYLDVTVGVSAAQPGDFTVAAVLQGSEGQYIDLANATVYASTGSITLTLRFDGRAIRASKLDGPYTIAELLLLDDATLIKLDEADAVWTTPPYDHRQFGIWSELAGITKHATPEVPVNYGDPLTYTLVISAAPGTQLGLYDSLESTTWLRFVEQPEGITHVDTANGTLYLGGAITGTLTITPTNQITVSFVTQVAAPGTLGWTVPITNRACIYPFGGTLGACTWSNDATNLASHPHHIYLPLVLRHYP